MKRNRAVLVPNSDISGRGGAMLPLILKKRNGSHSVQPFRNYDSVLTGRDFVA